MARTRPDTLALEFDPGRLIVGRDTDVRTGLSAAALSNGHLWLACDEGTRLERFSVHARQRRADEHTAFDLKEFLDLPATAHEEADIEGMDIDDGWLWLVGSHSVKRRKVRAGESPSKVARKLADTTRDGNRHLLARVPLERNSPTAAAAGRRPGALPATTTSSALLDALMEHEDVHLAPFVGIPGKDNGFDIEGLAVRGTRIFAGLRGPVLREWCCVLELSIESGARGALDLKRMDGPVPYRKHFLNLGGLGARDLVWHDDDLLLLAGPSMAHDGPTEIWRWFNVDAAGRRGEPPDVRRVLTVPHGEGCDRAEALALFESGRRPAVLVVYDRPSAERLEAPATVRADIFRLD